MRLILLVLVLLTTITAKVSAQDYLPPVRHTTIYVDMSAATANTNWQEITGQRLWAPCQHGTWQWWRKVRVHRGPGWENFAGFPRWFDDRIQEQWVSEHSLRASVTPSGQSDQAIRHTTINIGKLRDQALKEAKVPEQSTAPKRFYEPVYRVPRSPENPKGLQQNRESKNQFDSDDGWRASPKPTEEKKRKTKPRRVQPSGPVMLCEHCQPKTSPGN